MLKALFQKQESNIPRHLKPANLKVLSGEAKAFPGLSNYKASARAETGRVVSFPQFAQGTDNNPKKVIGW